MSKKRVAILISGGGSNMVSLIDSMTADHPARPVLVLSNNPNAGGLQKAAHLDVPTATVDHRAYNGDRAAFEAELQRTIERAKPDVICLAGFMRILSAEFMENWRGKMLNIHPSILPLFKGLHTHQRALDAGMAVHGCTVHEVTPELDDGPILGQAVVPVLAGDTPDDLAARLLPLEHRLYPAVLRNFAGGNRSPITILEG